MALATRYGFKNAPTVNGFGWSTLTAQMGGGDLSFLVADASAYLSSVEFDVIVGLQDQTTGEITNGERMHVTVAAGLAFTVTRSGSLVHAAGESVLIDLTAEGLAHAPGVKTDAGDMDYLGSDGRMARLAAPANGDYVMRWTGAVPSYVAQQSLAAYATIAYVDTQDAAVVAVVAAVSASFSPLISAKAANLVYAGPASGSAAVPTFRALVAADLPTHTHTAAQVTDLGSAAVAFTNKAGNISQWTNDASYTTLAAVAGVGYLTSVTAHNLLSATHGDALAGSVARGSVIVGNATPKWAALSIGAANRVLLSDGTDAAWGQVPVASGISGFGTGVATALAVNVGSAGAFVTFNGALGTPSSGTLTSATGLPISTGVSGLGAGIATWLVTPSLTNLNSAITGDVVVGRATTDTLTNKRITKRVTTASDATSITPATDAADITYQLNTQATGTLTINADSGTPTHGQAWLLKIKSTNVQTFAWNAIFAEGTTALPTVTTAAKIDYFAFIYDTVNSKWHFTGSAVGF